MLRSPRPARDGLRARGFSRAFALALGAALGVLTPAPVFGCAACFGKSDSPMAQGMNAGMFALLLCIMSVLVAIAIFFVYILRRAARLAASPPSAAALPSQPTRT